MKSSTISFFIAIFIAIFQLSGSLSASEKPIKHLNLPDIETVDQASKVFKETTAELLSNKKLDASELNDIHITTYSLEKAVAYFVENSNGDQQHNARELAEVVERIHLASENDRPEEVREYLDDYSQRAAAFAQELN